MKHRLTHNLGLKILSIIVAAVVWLLIMNVADPITSVPIDGIPVQIVNDDVILSRGYSYSVESGDKIDVRIRGKRTVVNSLSMSDFKAYADFRNLNDLYMVSINVECLSEHAKEIEIKPKTESMAIKREEQVTQPFNVKVVRNGSVKEGYFCTGSHVSTTLVQVTGSLTQVSAVKEIAVIVDVEGKSASFSDEYELVAFDAQGGIIDSGKLTYSDETVHVNVGICPIKSVAVDVITTGNPAPGYYVEKVEFAPATVNIAADEKLLKKLNVLVVPCDVTGAETSVDVQINLNDYLGEVFTETYVATDNSTLGVVVTIKPKVEKHFELSSEDIEIRNVSENLEASVYSLWNTTITLTGPEDDLEDVELKDLGIYVDMKDCGIGTYSRALSFENDTDLSITAGSVMVKLSLKGDEAETTEE